MSNTNDDSYSSSSDNEDVQNPSLPLSNLKVSSVNSEDGEMPWGYYNPLTEGKVTWNCGYDAERRIISIFTFTDERNQKEKKCDVLKDVVEAEYYRNELVKDGWLKTNPPKIEFTISDGKGGQRPINRKEKRMLERKIKKGQDISKL
jgi:hypothetical protein